MTSLSAIVDSHKVGDQVQVQVTRNGAKKTLTVKLGQRPDTTASDQLQQQDQQQQQTPDVPNLGGGW